MKVLHIASRELRSMFSTPVGWLVLCGYLLLTGVFWTYMVENYVLQSQDLVYNPMAAAQLNLTDYLLAPFYGNCAVVLVMMLPAVSMRSFSEEFRQRTMELLATSPVSTAEIVLGKFLGAFLFMLASVIIEPVITRSGSSGMSLTTCRASSSTTRPPSGSPPNTIP